MKAAAFYLFAAFWLFPTPSHAEFKASGDVQITGQAGVGTVLPKARLEVQAAAADQFALQVSSQDGSVMLVVDKTGKLGIGMSAPSARADVDGSGDSGHIGLQIRVGNSSSSISSAQIVFAYSTGSYRHNIRTQADATQNLNNAMDFYLWRSTGQPAVLGGFHALSLENVPAASTGSVHVIPFGQPDVELEVSNGSSTGGGTIHRAAAATHSSREIKTDIAYLGQDKQGLAYQEMKGLKHAHFRYKGSSRIMRGLIYEDAPQSLRGEGKTVVLDNRLANLELALKEAGRRIKELETKISVLQKRRRR